MKLYIANGTKQQQAFAYRLDKNPVARMMPIKIGAQIVVGGELTSAEIEEILAQHRPYGLIEAKEVDKIRGPFSGMCYSIDRPVDMDRIALAIHRKIESLEEAGKRQRQEAALATNQSLEESIEGVDNSSLNNLEMSIQEEEPAGGFRGDVDPVSEGIRVSRDETEAPTRTRRSRGRR